MIVQSVSVVHTLLISDRARKAAWEQNELLISASKSSFIGASHNRDHQLKTNDKMSWYIYMKMNFVILSDWVTARGLLQSNDHSRVKEIAVINFTSRITLNYMHVVTVA